MAAKKRKVQRRICITDLDDGSRHCTSLAAFTRANMDDMALVGRVSRLRMGSSVLVGGGAAPSIRITRVKSARR